MPQHHILHLFSNLIIDLLYLDQLHIICQLILQQRVHLYRPYILLRILVILYDFKLTVS